MSEDQVVLVCGASSGLGLATATHLAAAGYRVYGGMRELAARAEIAARLSGDGVTPVEIDVTDDASVPAGVGQVLASEGRIDVLFNGAGIMPRGISEAFSVAQLERCLQTNLVGAFRVMKAVLPAMRRQKAGLLLNVTSIGGRMATPSSGIYAASKWGLEGLAESIGYEVSRLGIDSVVVEPSLFLTELSAKGESPDDTEVLAGYEALADMGERVSARFRPAVAASGAPTDTASFAAYIESLIRMRPGSRPIRSTFGFDTGVVELNAATAPLQSRWLDLLGLGDLERVGGRPI